MLVADGEHRYVRINCRAGPHARGQPLHFVGQVEDVTERRAAERDKLPAEG